MKRGQVALLGLCLALASACRGFPSGVSERNARSVVNTGHTGAVLGLEFDDRRTLLFSAGSDGTVRVWDAAAGIILKKLMVTQLGTQLLAVNPAAPQVAVVVTDGTGSFFLSVWDWEKERQLFRISLKEAPLFLRFSAMGSFLVYGESTWQSLKILHAEDGTPFTFHPEGFGIVGFAEMSRSEKTIMTYQVSGSISYWDLATGQKTLDLPSVAYLSGIRISSDRRLIVGTTGREVVAIDTVTGAARGRAELQGAASLDISPAGDEIAALAAGGKLSRWGVAGDALVPRDILPRPSVGSRICYGADMLFLADPTGELHSLASGGEETRFGKNLLANIGGFDAAGDFIALGSQEWIRVFSTDLLAGAPSPTYLRSLLVPNPYTTRIGLAFLPAAKLLAWRADDVAPEVSVLDISGAGEHGTVPAVFHGLETGFRAPLTDVHVSGDSVIGIETGGVVRLTDTATGASRFDLRITGVSTAIVSSPTELVIGRNSTASSGSLMRVAMRTRETVAIRNRNVYTYALLLDPGAGSAGPILYSVGVDPSGATNLLRHEGPGFERETLLDSITEEDLDASLALDPETHVLYAALGRDRIVSWDGSQLKTIAAENAVPRRLVARNRLLYSLNKDSTVTVLNSASGAWLAQISLFADGEWCALFRDGRYAASPGGDVHVKVFADNAPVEATEDYRLRIGG